MTDLFTNLVSYWKLDETSGTRYASHSTNHLTDANSVLSAAGKIGTAALFVRADEDSLYIGAVSSLTLAQHDSFALGLWFYPTSIPPGTNSANLVLQEATSLTNAIFVAYIWGGDGHFYFEVNTPSGTDFVDGGAPTLNAWHYAVCWHDADADTLNVQVDSGAVASTAHSAGLRTGGGVLSLGAARHTTGYGYDGRIDEVGLWIGRILTVSERTALYNSGAGLPYPFGLTGPTFTARPRNLLFTAPRP